MTFSRRVEGIEVLISAFVKLQGYFLNRILVNVTIELHGPFYIFRIIEREP
jgi:hypothetical protein